MPESKTPVSENFESSLEELEKIVRQMEQGDLSLEASLASFEKGVQLTRQCQEKLKLAEQRVSKLVGHGDETGFADFSSNDQPEASEN